MKTSTILWLLWTIILLALLLSPINDTIIPPLGSFRYWDKVAHFLLFAITGFISIFGSPFFSKFRNRCVFGFLFGLVLAVGTELGQSIVPFRDTSLYDFLFDLAGVCSGVLACIILYSNKAIRSRLKR